LPSFINLTYAWSGFEFSNLETKDQRSDKSITVAEQIVKKLVLVEFLIFLNLKQKMV